ncbi:MAG: type IV toxin-antitoxin system AbiEi family antitoxin domain-containing protein [Candidatus Micrarchaeota archaeon]|nr:type IV toxin-antitoxin system AbiEi family antitoxin domain-containing protein [Candidatus Micrarchaeota archaeon]
MNFGEMELRLIFSLEQKKDHLFSMGDAKRILGSSDASVWNVLKRLMKKKRVIRLQRGAYLFAPLRSGEDGLWSEDAFRVVPSLVNGSDYYIGFVSAMSYWGMTEQLPIVVYVALKRQKRSLEAVQARFVFVRKKRLGDFVPVSFGGTMANVSSVEQTIWDGLSFPEYCLGIAGVAKAVWFMRKTIDWQKLLLLAKDEKSAVRRRLGYLLELLGFKKHTRGLEGEFVGYSWLEPSGQKREFEYSKKWGLKLNAKTRDLLEFMEGY